MSARGEARRDRIVDYLRRTEHPSLREIAVDAGFASIDGLKYHLEILHRRGQLTWKPGLSRTIRLTEHRVAGVVDGRAGYWTLAEAHEVRA